ncbi:hypothetical protein BH11MYX3_BH11MYX3_26550 [soil metagenome]
MKTALSIAFVLLAACGGKKSAPATPPAPTAGGDEHANMMPEVAKFHDVLAPRWHAEKGAQRMADTCGAMAEFQANADALAKATPPTGADVAAWSGKTKELTDAVGALDGTCKANDATTFEPAFERVHNGFHAVMEVSGGHKEGMSEDGHDEHGEHADHKM